MANRHRRRFLSSDSYGYISPPPPSDSDSDSSSPPQPSPSLQPSLYYSPSPSPPSPVLHTFKVSNKSSKNITLIVVLFLCSLAIAFLFLSYLTVRKQRNSRARSSTGINSRRRRRRRRTATTDEEMENPANLDLDLLDDDQSPVLDHPIWYIRTVGLQQSVIDSITIFKYKRGESLIEGADCSVCLSEFEEDETLRLLPKCSHAFHIHCIDTWLSSHQNCPLCRAPIVSPSPSPVVSVSDSPNSTVITISDQAQLDDDAAAATVHPDPESLMNSRSQRVDHVFPDEINVRLGVDQFSVDEEDEEDQDRVSGVGYHKDHLTQGRNRGTRVLSDLGDHRRSVLKEEEEDGSEGAGRRSVSMDASSAAYLTASFLTMAKAGGEGCSSNHEPAAAAAGASASLKSNNKKKTKSNSMMDGNHQDGDRIMSSRVTKTYSFGRFLQRGPSVHDTDLKRSTSSASASASSSGGFFSFSSKH